MQTIRWTSLLALGMLVVPAAGRAQAAAPKGPQPKITEIATIPGVRVSDARKMPNGRVIIYVVGDSILAYDRTTRKSILITRGFELYLSMSPRGDRIVYFRSEKGTSTMPWTIALDPETGAPAGVAQRVSTRGGDSPGLSPDGKLLTYFANFGTSAQGQDLVVIPATGGVERILAHYDWSSGVKGINAPMWSADGKWIYVLVSGDSATSVERIPATGGMRERVFSHTPRGEGFHSSIEGQVSLFGTGPVQSGRIGYVTANGVRGEFATPAGTSWNRYSLGSPGAVVAVHTAPVHLQILNLEDGKIHALPFEGVSAASATWSPDQKRLALMEGEGEKRELVVMNSDGSGQRRYPVKGSLGKTFWSPDGKSLLYYADSTTEMRMLNLATGVSRVITKLPAKNRFFGLPYWQPDGKAFRTMTFEYDPVTSKNGIGNRSVVDIGLDGSRRAVRELSSVEFPSMMQAFMTSARQAVVGIGDKVKMATRFILVPLDGGSPRPAPIPALEPGIRLGFVTGFSEKWLTVTLYASNGPVGILVMSTGTDSTRVLRFPAQHYAPPPYLDLVLPDGEHLVKIGFEPGTKSYTLVSVPIDGSAPRTIRTIPELIRGLSGWEAGLSTDGKQFAFFSVGTPTTHIYDIDLSPILKLIKKP